MDNNISWGCDTGVPPRSAPFISLRLITNADDGRQVSINLLDDRRSGLGRSLSQTRGHHIANNGIFTHVVGLNDTVKEGKFRINMLGEYNIGGDAFEIGIERETGQDYT